MTKRQLIRYIRSLTLHVLTACILATVGICCFLTSVSMTNECYELWSNTKQTDAKLRRAEILRAIELQPHKMQAYKNLLSEYLADHTITRMEHEHLQGVLNAHHDDLTKHGADAADFYRTLGFEYMACYEKTAQERLKIAADFFDTAAPTPPHDDAEAIIVSVYTEIFYYYAEFVWSTGYIRQPSSEQVSNLLHHISAAMTTVQKSSQEDRLAFYACVADLITSQEEVWAAKYDPQAISAAKEKILLQTQTVATTPTAQKLLQELNQWKKLHFPEEEGNESV